MPKSVNSAPLYFRHFNTIRFVAALMVFYSHMQQGYYEYICKSNDSINHDITGRNGVLLFFVLSGFLITSLLLNEKRITDSINIRNFYIKRILRIWPLYYLLIIFAFCIAPAIDFFNIGDYDLENRFSLKFIFYSFFLNNLASFLGAVPYAWHLWSIATEEQFYIIWPVILKRFNPLRSLFFLLLIYLVSRFVLHNTSTNFPIFNILREWLNAFIISAMIIGGIFAYFLHIGKKLIQEKSEMLILLIVLSAIIGFNSNHISFGFFDPEIYSLFYGVVIFIVASSDKLQFRIEEFDLFSFFGKISYGLYMYQSITIIAVYKFSVIYNLNSILHIYFISTLLLVSISYVSYRYFESFFLNLKYKLK